MSQPITAIQPQSDTPGTPASAAGSAPSVNADFSVFLTLLTTQLRNQDPLKPVDSTEFVAQLASFSSVEQQTRTNELLESLLATTGTAATLSDAASWIGLEVSAPGTADFDGETPLAFFIDPPSEARSAEMTVYNDFGVPVARMAVPPEAQDLSWDGLDSAGTTVPVGSYTAEVSYALADETVTRPAQPYALVDEVRLLDGAPLLLLDTGARVEITEVGAVRGAPEA